MTYDEYVGFIFSELSTAALDPLNTTGSKVFTTADSDDAMRYLETALIENTHWFRIIAGGGSGAFEVVPSGTMWSQIQAPVEPE